MSYRTTVKTLEAICKRINEAKGAPLTPYTKQADGKFIANVGNYHLSGAYGGYCLHLMENQGGGISTPLVSGHVPKRELELAMRSFLSGIESK